MAGGQRRLRIEGMSCEHCVRAVAQALEGVPGVTRAEVSLAESRADVQLETDAVPSDRLVKAVEEAGYRAWAA